MLEIYCIQLIWHLIFSVLKVNSIWSGRSEDPFMNKRPLFISLEALGLLSLLYSGAN